MSNENKIISYPQKFYLQKIPRIILLLILNFFVKYKIKKIFCISKQIKKNYDFLGYKKKTILMPLGYDKKIFKRKNTKNKIFTISYFGRISREKGIHILIKALEKVEFKFNFFLDTGHVEDKNYFKEILKKLKKILPPSHVSLINCNHFEIANFMSKSDLVVLPSIYEEQYGRVIQESVACGSLVIGSRVGAIPEIIKDNDLLFEKNNYRQLAAKINLLKNRNFYKNKIKKIYKIITKERTLDKQLHILKNLF
jgi:glycosyltransferase involved in cell wall biosynthesis